MQSLRFRVLTSMLFREPGEFDPTARGIQTRAASFPLPRPSTTAGAIATLIFNTIGAVPKGNSWIEEYYSILRDVVFRGPYLLADEDIYVEDAGKLIKLEKAIEKAEILAELLLSRTEEELSLSLEKLKRHTEAMEHLERADERVGIGLTTKDLGIKIAKEGLIYSVSYIDYSKFGSEIEIAVDFIGDLRLPISNIVQLGGDRRITNLRVKAQPVWDKVREMLFKDGREDAGKIALYFISPALVKTGGGLLEMFEDSITRFGKPLRRNGRLLMAGRIRLMGAGYSLKRRKRKPIYAALEPGSLIIVERYPDKGLDDIYKLGVSPLAGALGYGTAIPVPVKWP